MRLVSHENRHLMALEQLFKFVEKEDNHVMSNIGWLRNFKRLSKVLALSRLRPCAYEHSTGGVSCTSIAFRDLGRKI